MRITTGFITVSQKLQIFLGLYTYIERCSRLLIGLLYQVRVYTSYDVALLHSSKGCFWNSPISVRTAVFIEMF